MELVSNPLVPKAKYSAFDAGVYLRVDVPGANEFEITRNNLQEESISSAVFEFKAKEPSYGTLWHNLDDYQRSYGGRVKVAIDPQSSYYAILKNGCFWMFFPNVTELPTLYTLKGIQRKKWLSKDGSAD